MKEHLAAEAEAVGFSRMRVTTPDTVPQVPERLQQFLYFFRRNTRPTVGHRQDHRAAYRPGAHFDVALRRVAERVGEEVVGVEQERPECLGSPPRGNPKRG